MITVLCTMAVVVLMAIAGCVPEHEHCTQGPGWRLECRERQSGAVHPSGLDRRTEGVVQESVRHPGRHAPPVGDLGRAEGERRTWPASAPSAPSTPVGVTERQAATPAGFHKASLP